MPCLNTMLLLFHNARCEVRCYASCVNRASVVSFLVPLFSHFFLFPVRTVYNVLGSCDPIGFSFCDKGFQWMQNLLDGNYFTHGFTCHCVSSPPINCIISFQSGTGFTCNGSLPNEWATFCRRHFHRVMLVGSVTRHPGHIECTQSLTVHMLVGIS